jgi:hypothetical protein
MTPENWDSYFCRVEGNPASILVDLGRVADAPLPDLPLLGYVRFFLNAPDEHGFPRQAEYDRLAEMEDALEDALRTGLAAVYVGRSASCGRFDLFFYLPKDADWDARLRETLAPFSEYAWEAGVQPDPEWEAYGQFLFPDSYAMLGIQNRRICRQLLDLGDDPAKSRRVEHWATFPDAASASAFSLAASRQGFHADEVREEDVADASPDSGRQPAAQFLADEESRADGAAALVLVQACVSRLDAPGEIDEATFVLTDLALAHGGVYEGWACPVME